MREEAELLACIEGLRRELLERDRQILELRGAVAALLEVESSFGRFIPVSDYEVVDKAV